MGGSPEPLSIESNQFGFNESKGKGKHMTTNNTYVAVFLGSKTSPRMQAWMALPEAERRAKEREGIAAWKAWVEKHHAAVAVMGGAARQDEAGHRTRRRGREQRDERLHGGDGGLA